MRTRRLLAIVALAVGLQSAGAPDGAAATRITALTSPGGISAWLVHEPSIPIITLDIAFRGGSALDPLGKEGLLTLSRACSTKAPATTMRSPSSAGSRSWPSAWAPIPTRTASASASRR